MGLRKKFITVALVLLLLLIYKELVESSAEVKINAGNQIQKTPGLHAQAQKSTDTLMQGIYFLHRKILIERNINVHNEARNTTIKFDSYLKTTTDPYQRNKGTSGTTKSGTSDASKLRQTVIETRPRNLPTMMQPKTKTSTVLTPIQGRPPVVSSLQPSRATTIQPPLQTWRGTTRKPVVSSASRNYVWKQNTAVDYELPSWINQCSDVYLDLGSNIGVQVRKLFEPEKYPVLDQQQNEVMTLYNREFGDPTQRKSAHSGLCAFGFEPNPKHTNRLKTLENQYLNKGWKVHFFPFAVSNTDKMVTLYTENELGKNDWGATLYRNKGNFKNSVQVRQVRLTNFVKQLLNRTRIYVIKFDVEAAEYEILVDLLQEGLLCQEYIKLIIIEWHLARLDATDPNSVFRTRSIKQWIITQRCIATKVFEIDDETYKYDIDWHSQNQRPPD